MKKVNILLAFVFLFFCSVSAQENNSDGKNFFLGLGPQGNVYLNTDGTNDFEVWKMPSLGGNLFFGKWFSTKIGGRIFFEGGTLHPFFSKRTVMVDEKYVVGRLDFLLNLTNCFKEYSPDRFYNLIPYAGVGYGYAFDAVNRPDKRDNFSTLVGGAGLLNTFRLSQCVAAFLNLGVNFADPNFDSNIATKKANGIASGSVGLIFNLGATSKKEVVLPPVVQEQPVPRPEPRPEPKPEPRPEPPKVETVAPFLENVFFRLDKSVIDAAQQNIIKKSADFLKANPNASLTLVGYADVKTGSPKYNLKLSEKRARNVAKELVEKYNINSNRIKIEWKGDTVQPYKVNEQNRVVILTN